MNFKFYQFRKCISQIIIIIIWNLLVVLLYTQNCIVFYLNIEFRFLDQSNKHSLTFHIQFIRHHEYWIPMFYSTFNISYFFLHFIFPSFFDAISDLFYFNIYFRWWLLAAGYWLLFESLFNWWIRFDILINRPISFSIINCALCSVLHAPYWYWHYFLFCHSENLILLFIDCADWTFCIL